MAKVLGEPGRYVTEQAIQKFRKGIMLLFVSGCICAFLCGMAACLTFSMRRGSSLIPATVSALLILVVFWIWRIVDRMDARYEKERLSMRKGAIGEAAVALILDSFPNDYWVIHDLTTPSGNLDHVVVGPTGVFVIDTKNWTGVVSADGHGELLLNGKPREKAAVKTLVGRTMAIRDKVLSLCANDQTRQSEAPFFHSVLAFPSAQVTANWGSTGVADCVRGEKLWDYIVEDRKGRTLSTQQVDCYAKAFRALAQMDADFEVQVSDSPPRVD